MEVIYSEEAEKDILSWKKSGNKVIQARIQQLIRSIEINPTEGIGKPELLKYQFSGYWSRRINKEHRIIYQVIENGKVVKIHSLRGHYQ